MQDLEAPYEPNPSSLWCSGSQAHFTHYNYINYYNLIRS
jgi:hypothetical protein